METVLMSNCFGYLVFLFFLILFLVTYKLITIFELRKAKKKMNIEIKRIEMVNSLLDFEKTNTISNLLIKNQPNTANYLMQSKRFLLSGPFKNKTDIKLVTYRNSKIISDNCDFTKKNLMDEFPTLSAEEKEKVYKLSSILEEFFMIEHPVKYKYWEFKKNSIRRIWGIFSAFRSFFQIIFCVVNKLEEFDQKNQIVRRQEDSSMSWVEKQKKQYKSEYNTLKNYSLLNIQQLSD